MTTRHVGTPYRIDPFDLQLFAAAVEEGSITAGARRVHLSLAAASSRLSQLEHTVGAVLLRRSKRGVDVTDAGRTLMRHAARLAREMELLHAEMAAHAHGIRTTVRVLSNTAALTEYLPALLGGFLAAHPQIDVDLRELDSRDALAAMRLEKADIAIVADHVGTVGLRVQPFRDDRLVAVLPSPPRTDRKAMPRPMPFATLIERPFVGLPADSGLSRFLQDKAMHHGRALHHRVRVQSLDAVVRLVADGVGVAVVPEAAARRLVSPNVVVRLLADEWSARRLLACTPADGPASPATQRLLAHLVAPGPGD